MSRTLFGIHSGISGSIGAIGRGATLLAAMAGLAGTPSSPAQEFSSSAEYQSILKELNNDLTRPSRLGAGTSSANPPADLKSSETAAGLRIETALWRLEIAKDSFGIALTNNQTGLRWKTAGLGWTHTAESAAAVRGATVAGVEGHGGEWRMRLKAAGTGESAAAEISVLSSNMIRVSIRAPQHRKDAGIQMDVAGAGPFFGLGERFDRVKLDGLKTELRSSDFSGQPGHNWTYLPVPLLFTPRGLGVYLDTAEPSTVDLSHADRGAFSIQLQNDSVDVYFFAGLPREILRDYTGLMGRAPMVPPWTYGVWICAYRGPDAVSEIGHKLREDGIPASAIWTFDVMGKGDIQGWPLWWTGYYPDPRRFTDELHGMGFRALTYVHPYLRAALDPYNLPNAFFTEGLKSGLMVLDAEGQPTGPKFEPFAVGEIDFTSAANVKWWDQRIREIVVDDNFDGWMEDFGEWVHDTDRFQNGAPGLKMANMNPLIYHRITYELSQAAKPGVVEFDRSGYAGSQGYTPVIWGGDQQPNWTQDYGLSSVVRAGITAGLSGFPVWGPDIDGNGFSNELWTRWVEFGALTPVMRTHDWDMPIGSVNLWSSAENIATFKRYARLHISLFPYIYGLAAEASKTGVPIIRQLSLEFPGDPKTYDAEQEYLLGDRILVAPVTEQGAVTRSFYLPSGAWLDYWTGKQLEGGQQVTVEAPLDRIPILVRAGSIVPLISEETETLASDLAGAKYRTWNGDVILRVFPATGAVESTFTLYDGTVATANQKPEQMAVQVENSAVERNYEVMLPAGKPPLHVVLNGKSLSQAGHAETNASGWSMDEDKHSLHVRFRAANFKLQVD